MRDVRVALVGVSDAEEARARGVLRLFCAPAPCAATDEGVTHIVLGSVDNAEAQRVRHTPQRVPVVRLRWLAECEARAAVLDCTPFVIIPPSASSTSSSSQQRHSQQQQQQVTRVTSTAPSTQGTTSQTMSSQGGSTFLRGDERTLLQGLRFVSAGFSAEQTARNRAFVEYLGGVLEADDDGTAGTEAPGAAPAPADYAVMPHGVARAVRAAVLARHPGARPVSPQWLELSHHLRAVLDSALSPVLAPLPQRLPLAGMGAYTLSLSGFCVREKPLVVYLAHDMGARCTEDFTRAHNNLLVCRSRSPASDKYRAACRWGVPAVPLAWLNDSATSGRVLPVADYLLNPPPAPPAPLPEAVPEPLVVESSTTAVLVGGDAAPPPPQEGNDNNNEIENTLVRPEPETTTAATATTTETPLDSIILQCVDDIRGRSTAAAHEGVPTPMAHVPMHRFTPVRKRARADASLIGNVPATLSAEDQQSFLGGRPVPPLAHSSTGVSSSTTSAAATTAAVEGSNHDQGDEEEETASDSLSQQCCVRYVAPKEQKPRSPASSTPGRSRKRKS